MNYKEQKQLIEKISKIKNKLNEREKEKFNMLIKRHKDDEELDKLSLNYLQELAIKYVDNTRSEKAKKNLENLFEK